MPLLDPLPTMQAVPRAPVTNHKFDTDLRNNTRPVADLLTLTIGAPHVKTLHCAGCDKPMKISTAL